MEITYSKWKEDQIQIDKIPEPGAVVLIPEEEEGLPVTALGAYVCSGSEIEEVHIPIGVKKIGAYAFYGCQQLKAVYMGGRALDLGTGLFADTPSMQFLDFTEFEGERSCFKDILSEIRQTLRVRVHRGNQEARLIFPEYFEESVENTPARILVTETHGCGHRYRYCFANREFQFAGYDELFPHVKVQESEELVTELAIGRILYPWGLSEKRRQMYLDYVREHWKCAGTLLIQADSPKRNQATNLEPGGLPWLVESVLADTQDNQEGAGKENSGKDEPTLTQKLAELIAVAQKCENTEMVSWLMNYRHFHADGPETSEQKENAESKTRARRRRFEL
ncbi:leucine-rich repeat protein [Brotaphodocola sp.]|uniref:leucine-rich repeat protein n=1 Tax=Brotaphodocola sp. TaxID=3073577 RepID=UPI003D7EA369